ncbi:hypothetical protein [Roseateles sp. P5_E1]
MPFVTLPATLCLGFSQGSSRYGGDEIAAMPDFCHPFTWPAPCVRALTQVSA